MLMHEKTCVIPIFATFCLVSLTNVLTKASKTFLKPLENIQPSYSLKIAFEFPKIAILVFVVLSVNNILLTSIQLQVYNSMINREKINRI